MEREVPKPNLEDLLVAHFEESLDLLRSERVRNEDNLYDLAKFAITRGIAMAELLGFNPQRLIDTAAANLVAKHERTTTPTQV